MLPIEVIQFRTTYSHFFWIINHAKVIWEYQHCILLDYTTTKAGKHLTENSTVTTGKKFLSTAGNTFNNTPIICPRESSRKYLLNELKMTVSGGHRWIKSQEMAGEFSRNNNVSNYSVFPLYGMVRRGFIFYVPSTQCSNKEKGSEQRGLDRPIAEQNIRHDTEQTSRKSSKGEALHTKT